MGLCARGVSSGGGGRSDRRGCSSAVRRPACRWVRVEARATARDEDPRTHLERPGSESSAGSHECVGLLDGHGVDRRVRRRRHDAGTSTEGNDAGKDGSASAEGGASSDGGAAAGPEKCVKTARPWPPRSGGSAWSEDEFDVPGAPNSRRLESFEHGLRPERGGPVVPPAGQRRHATGGERPAHDRRAEGADPETRTTLRTAVTGRRTASTRSTPRALSRAPASRASSTVASKCAARSTPGRAAGRPSGSSATARAGRAPARSTSWSITRATYARTCASPRGAPAIGRGASRSRSASSEDRAYTTDYHLWAMEWSTTDVELYLDATSAVRLRLQGVPASSGRRLVHWQQVLPCSWTSPSGSNGNDPSGTTPSTPSRTTSITSACTGDRIPHSGAGACQRRDHLDALTFRASTAAALWRGA